MIKKLISSALLSCAILATNVSWADEIYSITEGTETDYNFNVIDKSGNKSSYKINLSPENMGQTGRVMWSEDLSDGIAVSIELPNGEVKTLYYKYTQPESYPPSTPTDINADYISKYNNVTTSSYDARGGAINNVQHKKKGAYSGSWSF